MPHAVALALVFLAAGPADPPPGQRIDLGDATLFIPDGYRARGNVVNIVFHLHGAATVVEPALVQVGWPAVLVEFNRKGLSSVYTKPFSDPKLFSQLIDKTLNAVRDAKLAAEPRAGKIIVSSFSAGFGGVRELLKVPEHFDRIDAIILADSLYCGYEGDPKDHRVDPRLMAGFERFARAAAEGKKSLVLSHSAQIPEGYASTTETADYLMRAVGVEPKAVSEQWADGWILTRRAERGRFLVLGFSGTDGADHPAHLRQIARIWKAAGGLFGDSGVP